MVVCERWEENECMWKGRRWGAMLHEMGGTCRSGVGVGCLDKTTISTFCSVVLWLMTSWLYAVLTLYVLLSYAILHVATLPCMPMSSPAGSALSAQCTPCHSHCKGLHRQHLSSIHWVSSLHFHQALSVCVCVCAHVCVSEQFHPALFLIALTVVPKDGHI